MSKICGTLMESKGAESTNHRVPTLPPELITEILLRLPVKPLVKFRSVSKSWLALIWSPEFINTHLNISTNNKDNTHHRLMLMFDKPVNTHLKDCSVSSLLYDSVTKAFDLDCPMKKTPTPVDIVGSVNGLICLSVEKKYLFIWNPSIRKFKKLPDCPHMSSSRYMYINLMYGFGYDELHDDYKVVVGLRNMNHDGSFIVKVKMYSLNSDSWTSVKDFHSLVLATTLGMFVNGKLHWANETYSRSGWDIISVDLADRKLGGVDQPYYGERYYGWMLGVLGSDLSVFCNYKRTYADVWVMKEYGVKESWIKMFTICLPSDLVGYRFCPFFCMLNKGEVFICLVFEKANKGKFMIYNPKNDSVICSEIARGDNFDEAKIYNESLVWPFIKEELRMQLQRRSKKLR